MTEPSPSAAQDVEREPVVSVRHFITFLVWVIALALFFYFFQSVRLLFLGLLAASCLAAALQPLTRFVPAGRAASAIVVGILPALVAVGLVVLLSWLLAGPLKREAQRWPEVRDRLNQTLADWSNRSGLDQPLTVESAAKQGGEMLAGAGGASVLHTTTGAISGLGIAIMFVFFGSIFLLAERPGRLMKPIIDPLPPERSRQVRAALGDLVPQLRGWVLGTLCSMTVVGLAAWAGFALVGLDFAMPMALLAGLSEIIPTVGPAVAFLVALLFAAAQGPGVMLGVAIVYLVIQTLESYIIQPLVMKQAVDVPPVITLFTVVIWGKVFGAPGLFLAIPINLVLWSFYDHMVLRPRTGRSSAAIVT